MRKLILLLTLLVPATCFGVNVCDDGYFIRGDANGDEALDQSDIIAFWDCVFVGNCTVVCDWEAQDANDDGLLDVADVVYLINFLYQGGPPPPAPWPQQDLDPTEDSLSNEHSPKKGIDFVRVGTTVQNAPIQNRGELEHLHCLKWNNAAVAADPIVKNHDLVLLQSDNTPDCTDDKECVWIRYVEWAPENNPNGWFDGIGLKLNQHKLKVVIAYPWTNISVAQRQPGGSSAGCQVFRTTNIFTINAGRASIVLDKPPTLYVKFRNITQNKVGKWVNVENITPGINVGIKRIRRTSVAWTFSATGGWQWKVTEGKIGGQTGKDYIVWEIDSINDGGPDIENRFGLGAQEAGFKTGDNIRVERIRLWYPMTHYRENKLDVDICEAEYVETGITAWIDYERKRPMQAVGGVVWTGSAYEWTKELEE
ncbi:MAG: hypothetical protein ACXADW_02890 [Candidatus Hodarchaeales archaeon]|jgi:hypothetical protein